MSTDSATPASGGSIIDQVKGKIEEAVETVKREGQEGGKLNQAFEKLGDVKDAAAAKLGEAVETVKRESQEGGKIDAVKGKVAGTFSEVKDKVTGHQGSTPDQPAA